MDIFFFKNIRISTFSGSSWDLWAVTMSPAVENTRSLGTGVAGMERYALASWDSKGYWERLSLHHFRGQLVSGIEASLLYISISLSTPCMDWSAGSAENESPSRSSSAVLLEEGSSTCSSALAAPCSLSVGSSPAAPLAPVSSSVI